MNISGVLDDDEIQAILSQYQAEYNKEDRDAKIKQDGILRRWHEMRRRISSEFKGVDKHHNHGPLCLGAVKHHLHICTDHCTLTIHHPPHACDAKLCIPNMMLIDRSMHLYGCIKSGQHHFCKSASEKNRVGPIIPCDDTMMGQDGDLICSYSGIIIHQYVEETLFEKPSRTKGRFFKKDDDSSAYTNSSTSSLGDQDDTLDDLTVETLPPSAKPPIPPKPTEKKKRKAKSSPSDPQRKLETLRNLEKTAGIIILELLFEEKARQEVNEIHRKRNLQNFLRKTESYASECNKAEKIPFAVVMHEIYKWEMKVHAPLLFTALQQIPQRDRVICHYAKLCVRLWRLMTKRSSIRCSFHQFVLGLLYTLAEGMSKNGERIAEPDNFLQKYLPQENDLIRFGKLRVEYETQQLKKKQRIASTVLSKTKSQKKDAIYSKKEITSGRNNINNAISECCWSDLHDAFEGKGWTNETLLDL